MQATAQGNDKKRIERSLGKTPDFCESLEINMGMTKVIFPPSIILKLQKL